MKVLIADDTNTDRLLLKLYLSKLGHHSIEASNGMEAIEQYVLHENDIDLILMDAQMPQLNGFEAVKRIRQIEQERVLEWVPVIFLSASAEMEDMEKSISVGGDDYLIKPIQQKVLLAKTLTMQRIADIRRRLIALDAKLSEQTAIDS
ncbi:Transcriptional activator protein CopR [Marinomonas spartinae]|uniref:Transcriptional activator protein CopR n=1 Tax=Marinomonas spartinae TaxID=1792290 RepID=A0A1A8TCT1_9GAMM|nr:response regulator [Marinomonas spartinae]SBS29729.1 Transcriptional activator protein CopR [Marinomonas spartinae]SBS37294.1 Transcriptional activator protein CopR [Marinomonas spartinae]